MPVGEEYKVTILRPDAEGRLVFQEMTVPSGQSRVLLMNLTESEEE